MSHPVPTLDYLCERCGCQPDDCECICKGDNDHLFVPDTFEFIWKRLELWATRWRCMKCGDYSNGEHFTKMNTRIVMSPGKDKDELI